MDQLDKYVDVFRCRHTDVLLEIMVDKENPRLQRLEGKNVACELSERLL